MLSQGHPDLIATETARTLLTSRELARLAYTAADGLRHGGEEARRAALAEADRPGVRMARIAVRPTWVGVLDFASRFPGGATAEEFAQRGRS